MKITAKALFRQKVVRDNLLNSLPLIILFALIGCGLSIAPNDANEDRAGVIAASILPIADWCRQITPESIEVLTIIPSNQNPHAFEPNVSDMKKLSQADFIVRLGFGFDDWIHRTIQNLQTEQTHILVLEHAEQESIHVTQGVQYNTTEDDAHHNHDNDHGHDHVHDHGHDHSHENNPHYWLDPIWVQEAVLTISNHLQAIFPEQAETIANKTQSYLLQLAQLHLSIHETLSQMPHKDYVGYHGAFIHFAERYGLNEVATIEPWAGKEPSVDQVRQIVDALTMMSQPVIFIEPQLNPQKAQVLAGEVNSPVLVLDPIGDSTNPERDTYIELMRFNLNAFVEGLSDKNNKQSEQPSEQHDDVGQSP